MTLNNQTLPTFNGFSKFNRYVIVYCDECSGTQYSCECYQKDIFKKKYYCHICEGECSCGRMPYLLVNKPNLFDTSSWTNYNYLTKAVTICNDKTDKITYYENWDLFIPNIPLLLLLYHLCYNMKVRRISNTIKSLFVNNECNIKEINDILDRPKRKGEEPVMELNYLEEGTGLSHFEVMITNRTDISISPASSD
ncbi:hypothetical protein U3516DRAFT_751443 [Neocallimastix sp. 'constans']